MKLLVRNTIWTVTLILLIGLSAESTSAQGLAGVRIRVDRDSVVVRINGNTVSEDSFGNSLTKDAWFILNLEPGEYNFHFDYLGIDSLLRTETLVADQATSIEVYFDTSVVQYGTVSIFSDIDSASVIVADTTIQIIDSVTLSLPAGQHEIEVFLEGYEPLLYQFDIVPTGSISLLYKMRILQPENVTAADLGYEPQIIKPTLNEEMADEMRETYNSMAETFLIIPFGQGILARIIVSDNNKTTANALIISGAILSSGSYLLGKILSKRKRRQIIAHNELVVQENTAAKEMNKQIERTVRETNKTAREEWERTNRPRGKVELLRTADSE